MRKNIVVTGFGIISANGITPIENLDLKDFPFPVGDLIPLEDFAIPPFHTGNFTEAIKKGLPEKS